MSKKYFKKPSIAFLLLSTIFTLAFIWRASGLAYSSVLSDHISNFAITGGLIMLSIGPVQFDLASTKRTLLTASIGYAVLNLMIEFFDIDDIPLPGVTFTDFNTADPIDAIFGLTAIALIILLYFWNIRRQTTK